MKTTQVLHAFVPAALIAFAFTSGALAQSSGDPVLSETVIVTAPRLTPEVRAMLHNYVSRYNAPAVLSGQITRWGKPVCPRTDGLSRDEYTAFVTQRIRVVAAMAGAKVAPTPCKPNIEIYFTDKPQATLNEVHARDVNYLGYKGAMTVSHPVQAWYVTGTTGLDGRMEIDREVFSDIDFQGGGCKTCSNQVSWSIPTPSVGGYRLRTDLRSEFVNVIIIADKTRTADFKLGPVADYIALMALSRTGAFETCQDMPSITNLMAADCSRKTDGITDVDLGYLRGVYKMSPDEPLLVQQSAIAAEMEKSLGGR
ncbi:MAG TPA: hypothetical protein VNW15_03430 [Rhizomicrobium sp.]|jgi:hypothetical protein|nr:hypothetical protein [Rhizomicrobium sp.]